jgi:hypothetical protein
MYFASKLATLISQFIAQAQHQQNSKHLPAHHPYAQEHGGLEIHALCSFFGNMAHCLFAFTRQHFITVYCIHHSLSLLLLTHF